MAKVTHFLYTPFTGLGLYGGYRGSRWLRNRIQIFKQFVIPSLIAQTNPNFILWVSWRHEERSNKQVQALKKYLDTKGIKNVFTYAGVCFWDDKYEDEVAHERLVNAVHGSMGELFNVMGEAKNILMTIQPSDDCYHNNMVEEIQDTLKTKKMQAVGYTKGYVMDYKSHRLSEWNPETNPPFFTIKFPRDIFVDPLRHVDYTGPYKSHEHVGQKLKYKQLDHRAFIVGTHGENISTIFNHPYAGHEFLGDNITNILDNFGLRDVGKLNIKTSIRKVLMRKLPPNWQRKLRYLLGERLFARIYNWIRA